MDDATLDSLSRAYRLSPENGALLAVLLGAMRAADRLDDAAALLDGVPASRFSNAEERRLAARIRIDTGTPKLALDYLEDSEPASWILRSRALAALGDLQQGRAMYTQAIEANPTLEDPELMSVLSSRTREAELHRGGEPIRLKVISGGKDAGLER